MTTTEPVTTPSTTSISALELWSDIVQTPELVNYFRDVFDKVGIWVEETGEQLTIIHKGDALGFVFGLEPDVDCVVPLRLENINNLVAHSHDGRFDNRESWRIVSILFTPLTTATLRHPLLAQTWLRRLAGVEDLIHVYLNDPEGKQQTTHTLIFAASQWLVIPGLYGKPLRTYYLSPQDALEFQRHVHRAIRDNAVGAWWQFAEWYREWRVVVSEKHRSTRAITPAASAPTANP